MKNRSCNGIVNASSPLPLVTLSQCPTEPSGAPSLSEQELDVPTQVTQQGTKAPSPSRQAKVQKGKAIKTPFSVWMHYNK